MGLLGLLHGPDLSARTAFWSLESLLVEALLALLSSLLLQLLLLLLLANSDAHCSPSSACFPVAMGNGR